MLCCEIFINFKVYNFSGVLFINTGQWSQTMCNMYYYYYYYVSTTSLLQCSSPYVKYIEWSQIKSHSGPLGLQQLKTHTSLLHHKTNFCWFPSSLVQYYFIMSNILSDIDCHGHKSIKPVSSNCCSK